MFDTKVWFIAGAGSGALFIAVILDSVPIGLLGLGLVLTQGLIFLAVALELFSEISKRFEEEEPDQPNIHQEKQRQNYSAPQTEPDPGYLGEGAENRHKRRS